MSELKDCPFCGRVMGSGDFARAQLGICVVCANCGASTEWLDERDEAVAAWNRRPPSEPQGEAVDGDYFVQHNESWANAIYNDLCAADNQDVPLEECAARIVAALARAGYAVVPVGLPPAVLGEAALGPYMEQGNPRHLWDFLLAKTRAYVPTLYTRPQPGEFAGLKFSEVRLPVGTALDVSVPGVLQIVRQEPQPGEGGGGGLIPAHDSGEYKNIVMQGASTTDHRIDEIRSQARAAGWNACRAEIIRRLSKGGQGG